MHADRRYTMSPNYTKELRVRVAKEAAQPGFNGMEHVIAEKYGVKPWTVAKWRDIYLELGEEGLKKELSRNRKRLVKQRLKRKTQNSKRK